MKIHPQTVAMVREAVTASLSPSFIATHPAQHKQMHSMAKIVYAKPRATLTLVGIENGCEKVHMTVSRLFSGLASQDKSHSMVDRVHAYKG